MGNAPGNLRMRTWTIKGVRWLLLTRMESFEIECGAGGEEHPQEPGYGAPFQRKEVSLQ
jgi:hypothetical protein